MPRFSYHSAQASWQKLSSGANSISFYGFLTRKGFAALRCQVDAQALNAPAIVLRLDTALLAGRDDFIDADVCTHEAVALVVPPDRYEQALALSRKMASLWGVRRPVFLPEQAALAYQWAAHVAQSQYAKLPQPLR